MHFRVLIDLDDYVFDLINGIECVLRVFGLHISRLAASLQILGGKWSLDTVGKRYFSLQQEEM